ncbi:MAG: FG-GAP-like repeat-containing protein [Acidobacteriaceae bacterium]|nr:FG-GAP-like repeat-containing protein [Acidobacteriaceae bacterium]
MLGTVATNGTASPTGQISFQDTTNSNYVLGTGTLGPTGSNGIAFYQSASLPLPSLSGQGVPSAVAVGDFNGDGYPDFIVSTDYSTTLLLALGNGGGTFRTSSISLPNVNGGVFAGTVTTGDFNSDGKIDFAVLNNNGCQIFLGDGDGTFTVGQLVAPGQLGGGYLALVTGDLDGDGKPDLITVGATVAYSYIAVLHGVGDGTFTLVAPSFAISGTPFSSSLVTGDFDGDGKLDVAYATSGNGSSANAILLARGNGDGTFLLPQQLASGMPYVSLATADLNQDGIPDLVATNQSSLPITVLLGNGDGTFRSIAEDPTTALNSAVVAVGDFNGDGVADLVLPDPNGGHTTIFFGKGDGTFLPDAFSPSVEGYNSISIGLADFDGNGQTDIVEAIYDFSGDTTVRDQASVLLAQAPSTAAAYVNGVSPVGTGDHFVQASYAGDANNSAGISGTTPLQALQVTTNLTLAETPAAGSAVGQNVTLTATLDQFFAQNHYASGLISFYNGTKLLGTANVVNGVATFTTSSLAVGTAKLKATYPGDTNFTSSASAVSSYNVSPELSQTLTFTPPASPAYVSTSALLEAIATSGNAVTYSVVSGPAVITGSVVTYTAAGSVVLQADQPGGNGYGAAAPVQQTVTVQVLTEPVGTTSPSISTVLTIQKSGVLGSLAALTQGTANLDFSYAPGGSCTVGTTYTVGQTCTVDFTFKPTLPGTRMGGVLLADAGGNALASSYLYGVGVGPQVNYLPGTQSTLLTGLAQPTNMVFDGAGNLFVADNRGSGGVVEAIASSGYSVSTNLAQTIGTGSAIAMDGLGNLFVTNANTGTAWEIVAVGGYTTTRQLHSGLNNPYGLAVDAIGNVFIAESTSNASLTELLAASNYTTTKSVGSGFNLPQGIAFDAAGNLFVMNYGSSKIQELTSASGYATVQTLPNSYAFASFLAVNANGDLFVGSDNTGSVVKSLVSSGYATQQTLVSGITPNGIALDGRGNLYVSDNNTRNVLKYDYADPPTLTFQSSLIGTTSADSPQTVTITNSGNADLMFGLPGTSVTPTDFTLLPASTCSNLNGTSQTLLAANSSCTALVSFTPQSARTINGTLFVVDNNLNVSGTSQIPLIGTGTTIAPTLTFNVANHVYGDPPFAVNATSNSPGTITYSLLSGPATITGSTVTVSGVGTVVLQASQSASGAYSAATVTASFNVSKASQTINFPAPPSPVTTSSGSVTLSATASSGLPVTFSVVSGPGTISGTTLTWNGTGTIVIAANQAGNDNFNAAIEVTHSIVVTLNSANVLLTASPAVQFLGNPVILTATLTGTAGTPSGFIAFYDGSTLLATMQATSGSATVTTTTLGLGVHTIIARYSGDSSYAAGVSAATTLTIEDFTLTIAQPNANIHHGGTATFNLIVNSVGSLGLASDISLSVTGAPPHATSNFTPAKITTGSGTTAVQLSIKTANYPDGSPFAIKRTGDTGIALVLCGLFSSLALLPKRHKLIPRFALAILMSAGLLFTSGCGAGWGTQRFDITITAQSGQAVRTVVATITTSCADGQQFCRW